MNDMLKILTRRSFAAGKVRNLIAVLAIALTAVLFTSVTTIGIGAVRSMTLTMQMQKGSRSDGDIRNMNREQFEAFRKADFVKQAGLRMPVGFLTNTTRHNIELDVADEIQAELTFCAPSHGRMPEAANEAVASDRALRDLGVEPEAGAEVTIAFTAHGKEYSLPLVLSGWYEAANDQISVMVVGTAFRDAHPEIFAYTYDRDSEMAGTYFSDFLADSALDLEQKMDAFVRSVGGDTEDMRAPNYMPAVVNTMTNPPLDPKMIGMISVIILLFVFCGYLLIYNVFDIAVMKEIRRYGLYRTIGMSRRQVKNLINRQALWLACIGILLGLAAGFFIGKKTLPVVMNTFAVEYKNIATQVSPSPVIFLAAAVLTAVTVFLSTRKPVRTVAGISPIEAYHYVETTAASRDYRKSASGASLPRLAWSNLGRSRRRSVFIMISLMLCVVLLNCAGTAADSLDIEKQVAYMIRTDFAVVNNASANGQKGFTARSQGLSEQTMKDIAAGPGVTGAWAIYKNTAEDADVTYDFGMDLTQDTFFQEETGLTFAFNAELMSFGLGSDGRPICNVYGMEKESLSRMDIREGETDIAALCQKMEEGKGVLVGVEANRIDMSLDEDFDFTEVGDIITVYKNGTPLRELKVLAKAAINGDDEELGYTLKGPTVIGGDGLFLYLPSDIYREIYDKPTVYKYAFDVEDDKQEQMTAFLDSYMENTDPSVSYLSAKSARESAEGNRAMIRFVGGLLSLIFGAAGILNLVNTIITTILTRRHEFAVMRSIGMTERQLTRMMVLESIYYALGGCGMGLVMSAVLNLTIVKGLLAGMWQFAFRFTLLPALLISVLLILVAALIPVAALKAFHKGSMVEQLRVAD